MLSKIIYLRCPVFVDNEVRDLPLAEHPEEVVEFGSRSETLNVHRRVPIADNKPTVPFDVLVGGLQERRFAPTSPAVEKVSPDGTPFEFLLRLELLQVVYQFVRVGNELELRVLVQVLGHQAEGILEGTSVERLEVQEVPPDEVYELMVDDLPLVRPASVLELIPELDKLLVSELTRGEGGRHVETWTAERELEEVPVRLFDLLLAHGEVGITPLLVKSVDGQEAVFLPVVLVEGT
jgi:hypothetical protein